MSDNATEQMAQMLERDGQVGPANTIRLLAQLKENAEKQVDAVLQRAHGKGEPDKYLSVGEMVFALKVKGLQEDLAELEREVARLQAENARLKTQIDVMTGKRTATEVMDEAFAAKRATLAETTVST